MARLNGGGSSNLTITDTFVCGDQACMLNSAARKGDICIRTDLTETYILQNDPATTLSNWVKILSALGITGTGSATQVTYWSGASSVVGSSDFLWDNANKNINAGNGNTPAGGANALFGEVNRPTSNTAWSIFGGRNNFGSGGGGIAANLVVGRNNELQSCQDDIIGGQNNVVSGHYSVVSGFGNTLGGSASAVFGTSNIVGGGNSLIYGINGKTYFEGQFVHTVNSGADGDRQNSQFTLWKQTTGDTLTELALDGATAYPVFEVGKNYFVKARILGNQGSGTQAGAYDLEFVFKVPSVATCNIQGLIKTVVYEDDINWDVTVTADTTNGRPAISVTGVAATTINWVSKVEMIETI